MKQTIIIYKNTAVEISRKGERLHIETPHQKTSLPLSNIDGVLIFGRARITSEALSLCAKNSVPVILLSVYGYIKAQILPPFNSQSTNTRIKQVALYLNNRLEVAKYFVKKKCTEIEYTFDLDLEEIKASIEITKDFTSLLGLEGQASRLMFQSFGELIEETDFTFKERSYHPPKDEVNALLSFLYTLGYNLSLSVIALKGYDPFVSFLHVKRGRHASFASDLVETIRPKLTRFAAELLTGGTITLQDFDKDNKGFFLKKRALYGVVEEFNKLKESLVNTLKEDLEDLEKVPFQRDF
ncbi:MAG: CRISPR-associated endonuclease Cas1 [Caldimicrobium sp.]